MTQIIKPPFNQATAEAKVQLAEDAWNSKDPERISLAYSTDSEWRNRNQFFTGREAIIRFLTEKWQKEQHYILRKYLWSFTNNHISVRFIYEWKDLEAEQWYRTHGNEHWAFDDDGLMKTRDMSANDIAIDVEDRQIF